MKYLRFLPLIALIWIAAPASAQVGDTLSIGFSGFVKFDAYHDTRQVVAGREGNFLLYPTAPDVHTHPTTGQTLDYSEASSLNFTAFFSRVRVDVGAPAALGARTSGALEADFLGTSNGLENTIRLRQAYVDLDWGGHALRVGQYWSPLFVPEVFPQTASYNLGAPIQPLAWFPQIRHTARAGSFRLISAISMQRDGFEDIAGRRTQQQAVLPGGHLHAEYTGPRVFAGMGGYVRTIRPELFGERFLSGGVSAYVRYSAPSFVVRAQGLLGTNMADHLMIGGYVETVAGDRRAYQSLQTASVWANVATAGRPLTVGLFAGYTASLGLSDHLDNDAEVVRFLARGSDLRYVWRVSPQVSYQSGPVRFALELEATTAQYCAEHTARLRPIANGDRPVTNLRTLGTVFFYF
ncbi:MAG: hypothetical protein ACOCTG_03240 [Bacteroidota bacterium]